MATDKPKVKTLTKKDVAHQVAKHLDEKVVPARRKTHFKPSKLLKEFLQQPLESSLPGGETSQDKESKAAENIASVSSNEVVRDS
jgi:hypothetical protein